MRQSVPQLILNAECFITWHELRQDVFEVNPELLWIHSRARSNLFGDKIVQNEVNLELTDLNSV